VKTNLRTKIARSAMSILLAAIGLTTVAFAQTSDSRKPPGTAVPASVEQAIRSFYDAVAHGDERAALARLANDGFAYDR